MGNSTISVQAIFDRVRVKGIPIPLSGPGGYDTDAAIAMAQDVMTDIIAERFNWKWNRKIAPAFYTNSFQQDYPQIGLKDIGWLEDCDRIDINNTAIPKPIRQLTVRRQLSRAGVPWSPLSEICWMYNSQLSYGVWPGPGTTYHPLITAQVSQNPLMNFVDANGNLLVLTQFGTTGGSAPSAAVNAAEGTTVPDNTCTWTVVSPNSQGFRVNPLPGASGPVWQVIPYYQSKGPTIASLSTLIDPIPDDYSRFFQKGVEAYCLLGSPNPGDRPRGEEALKMWLKSMGDSTKQGDRENDSYSLLPASSPVENIYAGMRNPQDPSQPY